MVTVRTIQVTRAQLEMSFRYAQLGNLPNLANIFKMAMDLHDIAPGCEVELTISIDKITKKTPQQKAREFLWGIDRHGKI